MNEDKRDEQIEVIKNLLNAACLFGKLLDGNEWGDDLDLDRIDGMIRENIEDGTITPDIAWFEYLVYEQYNETPPAQRTALCQKASHASWLARDNLVSRRPVFRRPTAAIVGSGSPKHLAWASGRTTHRIAQQRGRPPTHIPPDAPARRIHQTTDASQEIVRVRNLDPIGEAHGRC